MPPTPILPASLAALGAALAAALVPSCAHQPPAPPPSTAAATAPVPPPLTTGAPAAAWPSPAALGPVSTNRRAMARVPQEGQPQGRMALQGCTLRAGVATARVDMEMGWALRHGFVPARVASALGATELGWVDLSQEGGMDAGLLGLHGLNRTGQTRFRVVRIDRVDLGVGPAFGPVAALVLDEGNGDLGSVGASWLSFCPVGPKREGFVDSAADDTIYWLPAPD